MQTDDEKTLDAGSGPLLTAKLSAVLGSRLVYRYDDKVDPTFEVSDGRVCVCVCVCGLGRHTVPAAGNEHAIP